MVHLAIDGMWQVFKLKKSTPRNDFCRIAAKNGILLRLINTLYSLNEATRLASISGGPLSVDGLAPRLRSGQLDPNNPIFSHHESSLGVIDHPDALKTKHVGGEEPSHASTSNSQRSDIHQPDGDRPRLSSAAADGSGTEHHRYLSPLIGHRQISFRSWRRVPLMVFLLLSQNKLGLCLACWRKNLLQDIILVNWIMLSTLLA